MRACVLRIHTDAVRACASLETIARVLRLHSLPLALATLIRAEMELLRGDGNGRRSADAWLRDDRPLEDYVKRRVGEEWCISVGTTGLAAAAGTGSEIPPETGRVRSNELLASHLARHVNGILGDDR